MKLNFRVGIIEILPHHYCRDPIILKGVVDFRVRTLKKAGITSVLVSFFIANTFSCHYSCHLFSIFEFQINSESWETLIDREKIPFLMREIQEVCRVQEQQSNMS